MNFIHSYEIRRQTHLFSKRMSRKIPDLKDFRKQWNGGSTGLLPCGEQKSHFQARLDSIHREDVPG